MTTKVGMCVGQGLHHYVLDHLVHKQPRKWKFKQTWWNIPWVVRLSWLENAYSRPLFQWAILTGKLGQTDLVTARRSYASAVLGGVILSICSPSVRMSVRPSVCHTRTSWQNQTMHCGYFDTTRKGNHSSFLTPTVVGGRRPFCLKMCSKWLTPFEKRRIRQISAYGVSTARDSEKSSIKLWWIESRPRAFQWAIDRVHTLPLSPSKGGSKSDSGACVARSLCPSWTTCFLCDLQVVGLRM